MGQKQFGPTPATVLNTLRGLYELKSAGQPMYYIGADIFRDEEGNACVSAVTYIKNVCDRIEKLMEVKLKNIGSPLEAGDHPEMDESDLLYGEEITKYQMLCGCAQWAVNLTHFDVQYAVNTLA